MKAKYLGIYLFAFVLPLPLPLNYSSIAFIIMVLNLVIVDIKTPLNFKTNAKDPFFIGCLLFFLLDIFRAILTFSMENRLVRDVRLAFLLLPFLFLYKKKIIISQYENIIKIFTFGVFVYIITAWGYVGYYYLIAHPTYIFDFSDHLLIHIFAQEFPGAVHHTYIGMYITLSAMIIFEYTVFQKKISMLKGMFLVLFLLVNSFFIGAKISTALLIVFIFGSIVLSFLKDISFKKIKYYALFFVAAILFGLYSIKEWLSISINSSFNSRLGIYKRNLEIISDFSPLGIGKKQLNQTLVDVMNPEVGNLIPHNIYFNEIIVNGVLGITILLSLLGYLIYIAIKQKNFMLGFFMGLIILTGLVEDLMVRQRGVLFFVFFAALYYTYFYYSKNKTEQQI